MNEHDLASTFAELRSHQAPPHRLTPDALVAAGRQARRRRRTRAVGGGAVAVLCVAVGIAWAVRPDAPDRPPHVPPARHHVESSTPTPSPRGPRRSPVPSRTPQGGGPSPSASITGPGVSPGGGDGATGETGGSQPSEGPRGVQRSPAR